MATARIVDSFWTCAKRRRTERHLAAAGHRWPADPGAGPMSGAECIARLLAFLDGRGDPSGSLAGVTDDDLELEAGWTGAPGILVAALVACGWIDLGPDGSRRWHDFGSFNSKAIAARRNGAHGGRPREAGSVRDLRGAYRAPTADHGDGANETHDETQPKPMTKQSGSGSGSESVSESGEEKRSPAAVAAPDAASRRGDRPALSPEAVALAEYLRDAVRSHAPTAKIPANLDRWARDLDLALRIDGRTPGDVRAAIDYAHRDPRGSFWRGNILSGAKLREKFDALAIQAAHSPAPGNGRAGALSAADILAGAARLEREGR